MIILHDNTIHYNKSYKYRGLTTPTISLNKINLLNLFYSNINFVPGFQNISDPQTYCFTLGMVGTHFLQPYIKDIFYKRPGKANYSTTTGFAGCFKLRLILT